MSEILTKFIGYASILWGVFWAVKPEWLRDKLFVKAGRYIFWFAAGTLLYPLIHFYGKELGAGWIAGIVGAFWAGMKALKATLRETFRRVPLTAFRVAGFLNVMTGSALVWWPKH